MPKPTQVPATLLFVVSLGNAFDGIELHGPFPTMEDAIEWAEQHTDTQWNCIPLYPVVTA